MPQPDPSVHVTSGDRARIEWTIRQLLQQRTHGDIDAMLRLAHPDIVYTMYGARRVYPFSARHEGIEEIRRILSIAITEFENLGSTIHRLLIDGATVAVERTTTLRHRGTNAVANIDIVNFVRFQDGKVIEVSEHADTLSIERLCGRLPPADA